MRHRTRTPSVRSTGKPFGVASHRTIASLLAALLLQIPLTASAQIAAGKVNNFEDGTTQGWLVNLLGNGNVPPANVPTNIATGGPAGLNDNYLRLSSNGGQEGGGRLIALNPTWGGNYLAAGITSIRMDAINLGTTDLFLRLYLEDPNNAPPQNEAMSANAFVLHPGSGWQSVVFPFFGPGGLSTLSGNLNTLLANTTFLRILSSQAFAYPPPPTVSVLGVDNITAVGIVTPEPSTVMLFGAGAAALLAAARRRKLS